MKTTDIQAWLSEEGHNIEDLDLPEGYDFAKRVTVGGVSMILAHREGRPYWRLELRFGVDFGEHELDNEDRAKIKLHLRHVFQGRTLDYEIGDTEGGVETTLTRYLYPECLDRQHFMDELRGMQHAGLLVSGEVDRYVVGLVS